MGFWWHIKRVWVFVDDPASHPILFLVALSFLMILDTSLFGGSWDGGSWDALPAHDRV